MILRNNLLPVIGPFTVISRNTKVLWQTPSTCRCVWRDFTERCTKFWLNYSLTWLRIWSNRKYTNIVVLWKLWIRFGNNNRGANKQNTCLIVSFVEFFGPNWRWLRTNRRSAVQIGVSLPQRVARNNLCTVNKSC